MESPDLDPELELDPESESDPEAEFELNPEAEFELELVPDPQLLGVPVADVVVADPVVESRAGAVAGVVWVVRGAANVTLTSGELESSDEPLFSISRPTAFRPLPFLAALDLGLLDPRDLKTEAFRAARVRTSGTPGEMTSPSPLRPSARASAASREAR